VYNFDLNFEENKPKSLFNNIFLLLPVKGILIRIGFLIIEFLDPDPFEMLDPDPQKINSELKPVPVPLEWYEIGRTEPFSVLMMNRLLQLLTWLRV